MTRTVDLSVTVPSAAVNQDNVDVADVEPTTHPQEKSTAREPTEVQSNENSSIVTAQATESEQPQTSQAIQLENTRLTAALRLRFRISVGQCGVCYYLRIHSLAIR